MSVEVRLLGKPRITVAGLASKPPADRRSATLYYLAYSGGWVPREDLLYLLWTDAPEELARTSLRQLIYQLRSTPFAAGLAADRTRLKWEVRSDLHDWRDGATSHSIDLGWPGDLLDGFRLSGAPEFDSWLDLERQAWRNQYRTRLLEAATASGTDAGRRVAAWLDSWLAYEPLDEDAVQASLQLAARDGRSAAALTRYAKFEALLKEEYGVEPDPATVALVGRIRSRASAWSESTVDSTPATSAGDVGPPQRGTLRPRPLPRATNGSFVGRIAELNRLERELATGGNVVTILGPGGMGKTRLARQAAELMGQVLPDGVVWVPLAQVREAMAVAPAVADALGIEWVSGPGVVDSVARALQGKRLLIVLDNLEQVTGVADLIDGWSALAPATAWLLTSRQVVGARGEVIVELSGLGRPSTGEEPDETHESVALLLDRAARAGRPLELQSDRRAIADLVRLTGGMPLAIELAAGWLRVATLPAIVAELESGQDLASPAAVGEPRHRSVRTVIESAWEALESSEREALLRLTVFEGGFDETAAREVAMVGRPQLLALRNRSMLELDSNGRFGWHPLLEAFMKEKAAVEGGDVAHDDRSRASTAELRDRHARYYLELMARNEELGHAGRPLQAITTLRLEHRNLESAWLRALELRSWDLLARGNTHLSVSYAVEGRYQRWAELLQEALAIVPHGTLPWAELEIVYSRLDLEEERYGLAYERLAAAVAVLRAHGVPYKLGWGLLRLGVAAFALDRPGEAFESAMAAVTEFERAARPETLGMAYYQLVWQALTPAEHERWFSAYMDWYAANGTGHQHSRVLWVHGMYRSLVYGEHNGGADLISQALRIESSTNWDPLYVQELHFRLASVLAQTGDLSSTLAQLAAYDSYVAESSRSGAVTDSPGQAEADALRAEVLLRHRQDGAASLLAAGTDAAQTLRGLRVRAELALELGDTAQAQALQEQLVERTPSGVGTVVMSDLQVQTSLLAARVALARGDTAQACADLAYSLELALDRHMLPSLLHALLIATELLEDRLAAEVRRAAGVSHATPFHLRQHVERRPRSSLEPAIGREAAFEQVAAVCALVLAALGFERSSRQS